MAVDDLSWFQLNKQTLFLAALCTFIFFQIPSLHAQDANYQLLYQIEIQATHFTTDKLQNIYYISSNNEVVKLRQDGTEQFRFVNKTLGEPTHLDATNPFNLLLFYPGYQNIITLDRTMNLAAQYNLFELDLFGISAVGMAGDGNLWLYDPADFRLKKVGQNGNSIVQSGDLSLELNLSIQTTFILERDQLVYLNDPSLGILVFDVFGRYLKTIPLKGLQTFQIIGDELLYCKEEQMYAFHLLTLLEQPLYLPKAIDTESQIRVEKDRLYILDKTQLNVFQY